MSLESLYPADMPTQQVLKPLIERALRDLGGKAHRREITERAKELGLFTRGQVERPTHSLGKRRQYESELDYRLSWAIHGCHKDGTIVKLGGGWWSLSSDAA